jgi:hypothetical protein
MLMWGEWMSTTVMAEDGSTRRWEAGVRGSRGRRARTGDGSSTGVDGVYAYQTSFGLASGQVLHHSQGTLLPSSVNPRYQICGTNM